MSAEYCRGAANHPLHKIYHDQEYGFPIRSDSALFERFVLEINQAGLSWTTILNKRENFIRAYDGFDIDRVAAYGEADTTRLLADAGIIRNRLKIAAAVENARRLVQIRQKDGSFAAWLDAHHPLSKAEWIRLFKQEFVFTGGEIVGEFLISTGYLPGAHEIWCPIYAQIAVLDPPWMASI